MDLPFQKEAQVADMLEPRSNFSVGVLDNRLMVMGGHGCYCSVQISKLTLLFRDGNTYLDSVEIYSSDTNRFLPAPPHIWPSCTESSLLPAGSEVLPCWLQTVAMPALKCQGERFSEKTWSTNICK